MKEYSIIGCSELENIQQFTPKIREFWKTSYECYDINDLLCLINHSIAKECSVYIDSNKINYVDKISMSKS